MSTPAMLHRDAGARWHTFSLMEQLAHVGSEVERTIRAREGRLTTRFDGALARALELFDLTANDTRWRGHRRREILRAREEFCRVFFDPDVGGNSVAGLRRYFLAFAVAARSQRS